MTVDDPALPPGEKARRESLGRSGVVVIALIGMLVALTLGYLLKVQCNPPRVWDGFQYRHDCYTDMLPLYTRNPTDPKDSFYKAGGLSFAQHGVAYRDTSLEYPALTGLFISTVNTAAPQNDASKFFAVNALGLSLFGLIAAAAIAAIARRRWRILYLLFAPAMFSYAFHNWDLLALGLMCAGMWAFVRGRDGLTGAMLGLGAAAKIFPALILPAFALARRREGKPLGVMIWNAVIWFAIPNVSVLIFAGAKSWWFPWNYQSTRLPNFETSWYFILKHGQSWFPKLGNDFWFGGDYARGAQALSTLLFVVFAVLLLWRESKRAEIRPMQTAFGILILFLLTNKVFSPQYAIWLLPFFVVTDMPWHAFLAFTLGDMAVLTGIWAYFTAYANGGAQSPNDWHLGLLEGLVYFRYATLLYVLWWTRRRDDLAGEPERFVRGPAARAWEVAPPAPST